VVVTTERWVVVVVVGGRGCDYREVGGRGCGGWSWL